MFPIHFPSKFNYLKQIDAWSIHKISEVHFYLGHMILSSWVHYPRESNILKNMTYPSVSSISHVSLTMSSKLARTSGSRCNIREIKLEKKINKNYLYFLYKNPSKNILFGTLKFHKIKDCFSIIIDDIISIELNYISFRQIMQEVFLN